MKQNQLDNCKVKILENQGEFDILTKDSVWNIKKRALKRSNKIKGMLQYEPTPCQMCLMLFN